jgi:hypothetical protein
VARIGRIGAAGVVSASNVRQDLPMTAAAPTVLEPTDTVVEGDVEQLERAYAAPSFERPGVPARAPLGSSVFLAYALFAVLVVGAFALVAISVRG